MNKSLLPHLIKKDFRVVRFWLLALWIFLPLQWIVDLRTSANPNNNTLTLIMPLATYALIFFAQWRLFKIDPLTGGDHFLQTRPVGRTSLLASKLLLWFFAIILPAALIRSLYLLRFSLGLGASDYALIFIAWLVFFLAIFSVLLIPIVLTRNLGALLLSVAAMVLIPFLFGYFMKQYDRSYPHWTFPVDEHLKTSRIFMVQIFAILFSLIAIFRFYRTPRFSRILLPSGIGIAVVLLAYFAWPMNFIDWLAQKPPMAKRSEWSNQKKIHFVFENKIEQKMSYGWNKLSFQQVEMVNTLSGLPSRWLMKQWNYTGIATFANGEKLDGSLSNIDAFPGRIQGYVSIVELIKNDSYNVHQKIVHLSNGSIEHSKKYLLKSHQYKTSVFVYCKDHLPANSDLHANLKGRAFFKFFRPKIVRVVPFRNGETFTYRNRRWTIHNIKYSADDIKYKITREWSKINLRPIYSGWDGMQMEEVIFNKQAHVGVGSEFNHDGGSAGSSNSGFLNYAISVAHASSNGFENIKTSHHVKMTPKIMKGMKLYIIDYEYGGSFSAPFDVPSVELQR